MGSKIICADLNEKEGNRVADEIKAQFGPVAYFVKCNVANNDDVKRMFEVAKERFGDVDVVWVNGAERGELDLS